MQILQNHTTFVLGSESLNNVLYFTGKEWEQETGTYYFGARRYDPTIGQWLGRDPAGQFESPYVYAGNGVNPLTSFDPDGMENIYFLLGGTYMKQHGVEAVNPSQFKYAFMDIAKKYEKKGYTVKFDRLTKRNINNALNDADAERIYTLSHASEGKLKSKKLGEEIGPSDIVENKSIEMTVAGCNMAKTRDGWWQKLKSFLGLHDKQVDVIDAVDDLKSSANNDVNFSLPKVGQEGGINDGF